MVYFKCDHCGKSVEISESVLARARLEEANKLLVEIFSTMSVSSMSAMLKTRWKVQRYIHNNNLFRDEKVQRQVSP